MKKLSEARVSFLAHEILRALRSEGLVEVEHERLALADLKQLLNQEDELSERIDATVRQKIGTLSRKIPPGSREWDVLYRQYWEQELRKIRP
ncbi:MAG: DUF507 family protein [Deltaproteobacteria bacterium]|jgi:hypothetical protein|nr:DUF507 family protein [Deltaproteobacteria bacterium]MBI3388223.1 DUF507 family protein [Deltaproteobacteria bacterium]